MCNICVMPFCRLVDPDCFNPRRKSQTPPHDPDSQILADFIERSDWRYIKYSFRSRDGDADAAAEIYLKRGKEYSVMDEMPGWLPIKANVIEFMHAILLCTAKHTSRNILYKNGMFNRHGLQDPMERMESFFAKVIWPSSVGRLPPKAS